MVWWLAATAASCLSVERRPPTTTITLSCTASNATETAAAVAAMSGAREVVITAAGAPHAWVNSNINLPCANDNPVLVHAVGVSFVPDSTLPTGCISLAYTPYRDTSGSTLGQATLQVRALFAGAALVLALACTFWVARRRKRVHAATRVHTVATPDRKTKHVGLPWSGRPYFVIAPG